MSLEVGIALALVIVPFVIFCARVGYRLVRSGGTKDQSPQGASQGKRHRGHWVI
ncbi:MAG: hypothetical protein OJF62_003195 [Pseudolabrys sp.]|jgi:hypothetical protein|nr:hypothetical protein [Pseudolabrys sp.]